MTDLKEIEAHDGSSLSDRGPDQETVPQSSEITSRAVIAVVGAFFSLFISVGFMNAYGVFQEYYHQHQLQNKSEFDIAWIGSFATFMMFGSGAPAGLLVDKIGPTPLIGGGSIALVLGIFMTSLCEQYYQFFLAQGLLMGGAMAFLTIPCIATLSHGFTKHRGLVTGIAISGSSMGGVVWPILCDEMLNRRGLSFGWTMRINGFIMIPLAAIATLAVRPPTTPSTATEKGPSTSSLPDSPPTPKKKADLSILHNKTYLVFVAGATIFNLGMFSPFFFTPAYSTSLGHSASFSFHALSILNAASLFGRIIIGTLADRFGPFNLSCISALVGAVVCYCWTAATSPAGLGVWAVAYGFSSGAILSLQMQCAAALSTKETYGTAVGLAMGFASIAGLVGTPISGQLVPHGYLALSLYAATTLLVASGFFVVGRLLLSRRLWARV